MAKREYSEYGKRRDKGRRETLFPNGDAMKVAGWEVEAEREVGRDDDSVYYLLGGNIYRKQDSGTRWFCTNEAWEGCKKTYQIRGTDDKETL